MNLLAIIPSGQTEITVNGLHQWDYGRLLEIRSSSLPATVEVHFACSGMDEAVVRVCESSQVEGSDVKVVTAAIPDLCLEQTTPIVAWVYEVNSSGSSGQTTVTIKLPIMARPKPAPRSSVPTAVADQYTELLAAVNTHVDNLRDGTVIAGEAVKATQDGDGNVIKDTYLTKEGTAKRAEIAEQAVEAGYAYVAEYANSAPATELLKYSLVYSVDIENGICDFDMIKNLNDTETKSDKLYLLIFTSDDGSVYTGVLYIPTYMSVPHESIVETQLGRYHLTIAYNSTILLSYDGNGANGNIKFYKMGEEKKEAAAE